MRYFMLLIYLLVFCGTGFFLLRFFSHLAGTDMFAAVIWVFKAKRFELVVPLAIFYMIAFVMLAAIFMGLFTTSTAAFTHKAGLLGYPDGEGQYRMFDPATRRYESIPHYNPPPAANMLNETFEVVSFYKPLFSKVYRNVSDLSLVVSIIKIILGIFGIVPLYWMLFVLAKEYPQPVGSAGALTHAMIGKQFHAVAGMSVLSALGVLGVIVLAITLAEHWVERRIAREHQEQLGALSAEYRRQVSRSTAPGATLLGTLVRREDTLVHKLHSSPTQSGSDVNKKTVRTVPAMLYTLEFSELMRVPVYVRLQLFGDAASHPDIRRLDVLFADKKSKQPKSRSTIELVVNPDYTVSLTETALKP